MMKVNDIQSSSEELVLPQKWSEPTQEELERPSGVRVEE